jgi:predicted alpha-1,2-mannosidase
MTGQLHLQPGSEEDPASGYRSAFKHETEYAEPGFYEVFLEDCQVEAGLTATERCGFHRYRFPASPAAHILIDLTESIVSEEVLELSVSFSGDNVVSGHRRTRGWAEDQIIYFYAVFSRPFETSGISINGQEAIRAESAEGKDLKAFVTFQTQDDDIIFVKVGLSPLSVRGAMLNLEEEIPGWDFEAIRDHARISWNKELSKIRIVSESETDRRIFYSALYHAMIAPNLFCDADGSYRGHDGLTHRDESRQVYTVFSLWDTYRALHPLLILIQPERTRDMILTMIDIYDKGGLLPVWELAGNETFCMIGYHAVPVITDAFVKGCRDFDIQRAYLAMLHSATADHFGLGSYQTNGFIPAEDESESVSKTLEYAYDDWCIAQMAKNLGKQDDHDHFIERAQYYKNLFDPETRFIRGKRNGMFVSPFDPAEVNFMLTEANTWQYTFYVPQDISGLIHLMGGDQAFSEKLDELFQAKSGISGRQQADITGLIGQYAHGNEPSHHMAYLYNYSGKPYKTQEITRRIMRELYTDGPEGLCGNEDCGQMSAWYVFSAMGFYPVTPGTDVYAIGSPMFHEVLLKLPGGKKFRIVTEGHSEEAVYIQSARLNGKALSRSFLRHGEIISGGELRLVMGTRPNPAWGSAGSDRPVSAITEHLITPVPYVIARSGTFFDSLQIMAGNPDPYAVNYYRLQENQEASIWKKPVILTGPDPSHSVTAWAESPGKHRSQVISSRFHRIDHDWKISIREPYSPQYTAGGDLALTDGIIGGLNFRTGSWQGYYGVDIEVTIDMGKSKRIHLVSVNFLEDQGSWIFFPTDVEIAVSQKPYDFRTVFATKYDEPEKNDRPQIRTFSKEDINQTARYVRIKARNKGTCPDWHVGAGNKSWIFADEITIR